MNMNSSQPQLMDLGREVDTPDEWTECKDSLQLVSLGSSRFCIARFFRSTRTLDGDFAGDESSDQDFAVLNGVEAVPRVHDHANGDARSIDSSGNGK
jgi:hypothetical protein